MRGKILYITTIGSTMGFFTKLIEKIVNNGTKVEIAANIEIADIPDKLYKLGCKTYNINCSRSVCKIKDNIHAIQQIKQILKGTHYDIVHCHTPIASFCTRLACKNQRKRGTKVVYTAHGFHFYKNAPITNWLIYYPAEWLLSFLTDMIITMNYEDYKIAKDHFHSNKICKISGVGIDVEKFQSAKINKKRLLKILNIPEDAKIILSVGELNNNKNHKSVIRAMAKIKYNDIYYIIAGEGPKRKALINLSIKLQVNDRILLIGHTSKIEQYYKLANLYIHPSYREGLPVALLEAIASNVKCIASNTRGCNDLLSEDRLFSPNNVEKLKELIIKNLDNPILGSKININQFSNEIVLKNQINLYKQLLSKPVNN